jgi:acyl phosphate:glycerol-3-phosphate acyltransferase
MTPLPFATILLFTAYLIGAIPFGYLIARAKGVNLFQVGSGNIGATNVGRVLGRKYGILVFTLDFLKGALPVALVPFFLRLASIESVEPIDLLRVGVALAAFLGHLFPIYLKFRGGKGVATGAGTVFVLVPGPAAIAVLVWLATVVSSRMISLGSLFAAAALCVARLLLSPNDAHSFILTGFCFLGAAIVVLKHRGNLIRLRLGTENRIEAKPMIDFLQRALHLLALGLWLGSAVFFNLMAAPVIFASFDEVARSEPGDRTANVPINSGLDDAKRKQLGQALAGTAVGPLFPMLFEFQAVCGLVALITAAGWWKAPGCVNRCRVYVLSVALSLVAVSWPISQKVTQLRLSRLSPNTAIAEAAKADFATWHLYSLGLSMGTILLVFVAMLLAARLPAAAAKNECTTL